MHRQDQVATEEPGEADGEADLLGGGVNSAGVVCARALVKVS